VHHLKVVTLQTIDRTVCRTLTASQLGRRSPPATLAAEDQGAAREAEAWAAIGAGLDPGGGSRGASLGGLGIRAMSSFPFSRVGAEPSARPFAFRGLGHCLPQRRDQQHCPARLQVLHAFRLGPRFSGLLLIKLSPPDFTFVHDDAPGTYYKRLAALEVPEGLRILLLNPSFVWNGSHYLPCRLVLSLPLASLSQTSAACMIIASTRSPRVRR
jgi:hypothetical protein